MTFTIVPARLVEAGNWVQFFGTPFLVTRKTVDPKIVWLSFWETNDSEPYAYEPEQLLEVRVP